MILTRVWYLMTCSCTYITQIYVLTRVPSGQWLEELLDPLISSIPCALSISIINQQ
jgi:hypothetical protein